MCADTMKATINKLREAAPARAYGSPSAVEKAALTSKERISDTKTVTN
jgi:hypothetical protein